MLCVTARHRRAAAWARCYLTRGARVAFGGVARGWWQSLGAEHHQRDGENQEQMCGAEDVFDHLWSLWFGRVGPLYMRRGPARAGRVINRYGRCDLTLLGGWQQRGARFSGPSSSSHL